MWERLLVTFLGVLAAFMMDRVIERYKNYRNKKR